MFLSRVRIWKRNEHIGWTGEVVGKGDTRDIKQGVGRK